MEIPEGAIRIALSETLSACIEAWFDQDERRFYFTSKKGEDRNATAGPFSHGELDVLKSVIEDVLFMKGRFGNIT